MICCIKNYMYATLVDGVMSYSFRHHVRTLYGILVTLLLLALLLLLLLAI